MICDTCVGEARLFCNLRRTHRIFLKGDKDFAPSDQSRLYVAFRHKVRFGVKRAARWHAIISHELRECGLFLFLLLLIKEGIDLFL